MLYVNLRMLYVLCGVIKLEIAICCHCLRMLCHYLRILYAGLISVERPEKVTRGGGR
jgi:hypothetical protein